MGSVEGKKGMEIVIFPGNLCGESLVFWDSLFRGNPDENEWRE